MGNNGVNLAITIILSIIAEMVHFITKNHEVIGYLIQWFAWSGAGTVGVITFIRFLQDNGWVRKGKPKIKK